MMAGLLNLGIQPLTNEGRSLNQDQSLNHAVIDIASENDTLRRSESRKMRRVKWSLLLGSFTLEGFSIAFEQLSAPKKSIYAFMSMITASLGLLISIIELSFRLQENDRIISRLLGDALENFGFFGSTWQCIFAVVQYVFLYKKKINNPIKMSVLPLIFLICATMSRLYNIYRGDSSTQQLVRGEIQLTSSGVEASISLSNTTAIEETEPVGQDDTGVLITTELRDDTTVHRRVRAGQNELHVDNEVYKELVERTKSIPGAKVENNKFCLSVHFRFVEEKVPTLSKALTGELEVMSSNSHRGIRPLLKGRVVLTLKLHILRLTSGSHSQGRGLPDGFRFLDPKPKVLEIRPTIEGQREGL